MIAMELPYPPSVNSYWVHRQRGTFISDKGVAYRKAVKVALWQAKVYQPMTGTIHMVLKLYPPDKRRRDIDNTLKAILDSLQHGGLMRDDCQVKKLEVEMCPEIQDRVELFAKEIET